ncbi:hypothetical protein BDW74DRAFT_124244 [Aspergillus multicolor]|uniref:uncharacterized protein n=1 Tax=Aspergillus multicolor TaxID=41759 RepID=UPI003CCCB72D
MTYIYYDGSSMLSLHSFRLVDRRTELPFDHIPKRQNISYRCLATSPLAPTRLEKQT